MPATLGAGRQPAVQLLLRLHICHVLQVCSPHTADLDAGVPARGLNGEAYRGHVFWDELFVYPFLDAPDARDHPGPAHVPLPPSATRPAGGARRGPPRERCTRGRAAARGTEETQRVHLNPLSGRWDPDRSHRQRHVSAAIFYNVWHYFQATGDHGFLRDHGAEMLLEIARFWASIATSTRPGIATTSTG